MTHWLTHIISPFVQELIIMAIGNLEQSSHIYMELLSQQQILDLLCDKNMSLSEASNVALSFGLFTSNK